ncbi:hypothetical protein BDK51DRAFT_45380 [Blyttiomyces helicus]|uniref:Uncharacterized protein n=1 Tax=Blyttiomyces helicus TaxID=388810 RepID=A0A4P9WKP2_9FUNG|nr:hypothetical protein BDK51DRAFT_45380 [Blyttiomyces helicus]|eukprot:RKO91740.1 hypothetical protein BDK51DRAFT_45380 [Blyttiomyces helicus]
MHIPTTIPQSAFSLPPLPLSPTASPISSPVASRHKTARAGICPVMNALDPPVPSILCRAASPSSPSSSPRPGRDKISVENMRFFARGSLPSDIASAKQYEVADAGDVESPSASSALLLPPYMHALRAGTQLALASEAGLRAVFPLWDQTCEAPPPPALATKSFSKMTSPRLRNFAATGPFPSILPPALPPFALIRPVDPEIGEILSHVAHVKFAAESHPKPLPKVVALRVAGGRHPRQDIREDTLSPDDRHR